MPVSASLPFAAHDISLTTGHVARHANGAVWLQWGDTILLATATANYQSHNETRDFLALTVHYQEKFYAVGKIPGNYQKRQGKRSDQEVSTARWIDRALRPMFPSDLRCAVEVILEVLSIDPACPPDLVAVLAASSALMISDIPFQGPVATARVSHDKQQLVLLPHPKSTNSSPIDLLIASSDAGIVMLEAEAHFVPYAELLDAVEFGCNAIQPMLELQHRLYEKVNRPKQTFVPTTPNDEALACIAAAYPATFDAELSQCESMLARRKYRQKVLQQLKTTLASQSGLSPAHIEQGFTAIERQNMRAHIAQHQTRISSRSLRELRAIDCSIDLLPRVHGSSQFTRGDTQVLATTTLGSYEDEQGHESVYGNLKKHFYLHYNFPGYATGDCGHFGIWGRREIGHGQLAERALRPALPERNDFPNTIAIVAEVLQANGSTSMATVCAATLAMLAAGIPLSQHIAGISVALMQEDGKTHYLLDPTGEEDSLCDMDLKVCGCRDGITAVHMDLKIPGVSLEQLREAFQLAAEGRAQILDAMEACIANPQPLSAHAPHIQTLEVSSAFAQDLLGHGGKKLRKLKDKTQAKITVNPAGRIHVNAPHRESMELVESMLQTFQRDLETYTTDPSHTSTPPPPSSSRATPPPSNLKVGQLYTGHVTHITRYGAFVEIQPGVVGLIHLSELSSEQPVVRIEDYADKGQTLTVKLIQVDSKGRIGLSLKQAKPAE